jgi:ADP-ribose pyrophosphatase YjhB (NUDIX family)
MTEYIDADGKSLSGYTRPSVTVDTAVLTVFPPTGELCVVIVKTPEGIPCLPGTFIHENETLEEAAKRALREKVGLRNVTPVQLHVFDSPGRDPRGWVISVAHIAVLPIEELDDIGFVPVSQVEDLAYDHDEMLSKAVEKLRADYAEHPDPWNLLDTFTLKELREVHEAIDPNTPLRDSFRRLMQPMVVDTGEMSSGTVGKPSRIWRKETDAERIYAKYERPIRPRTPRKVGSLSERLFLESSPLDELNFPELTGYTSEISSSGSSSSERNYSLEIEWLSGEITIHDSLSPSQAKLRLREFEKEVHSASASLPFSQRPHAARIKNGWGEIEKEIVF